MPGKVATAGLQAFAKMRAMRVIAAAAEKQVRMLMPVAEMKISRVIGVRGLRVKFGTRGRYNFRYYARCILRVIR